MRNDDLAHLESIGVEAVLFEIAQGKHGQPTSQMREEVEAWLRSKQVAADAASSAKRDAREEETLSISRKALNNSNRANIIAISAIIIATACTIISIVITFKYGN